LYLGRLPLLTLIISREDTMKGIEVDFEQSSKEVRSTQLSSFTANILPGGFAVPGISKTRLTSYLASQVLRTLSKLLFSQTWLA